MVTINQTGNSPLTEGEFSNQLEGLGSGQLVEGQELASPSLGEIQLHIGVRKGCLEVEVIRTRDLQYKPSKRAPGIYVKVYLVKGRTCIAKRKTQSAIEKRGSCLYITSFSFNEDYRNCILQVTVWGNHGRMEEKEFLGVAQINLEELELLNGVTSWYKLSSHSSLVDLLDDVQQNSLMPEDSLA